MKNEVDIERGRERGGERLLIPIPFTIPILKRG